MVNEKDKIKLNKKIKVLSEASRSWKTKNTDEGEIIGNLKGPSRMGK